MCSCLSIYVIVMKLEFLVLLLLGRWGIILVRRRFNGFVVGVVMGL